MATLARPDLHNLIGDRSLRLRARARLDRLEQMRLVADAIDANAVQDSIASELGISQATVSRMVRQIRADRTILGVAPIETIYRRAAQEITTEEMMASLNGATFTLGTFDPTGGDGYLRGTWDQIATALVEGFISEGEYNLLARQVSD